MLVRCEECGRRFDDEYRWTMCPHDPLDAGYCKEHDLFNCTLPHKKEGENAGVHGKRDKEGTGAQTPGREEETDGGENGTSSEGTSPNQTPESSPGVDPSGS
jgi:hypothetical protein